MVVLRASSDGDEPRLVPSTAYAIDGKGHHTEYRNHAGCAVRLQSTEAETQRAILELLAAYRVYAFRLNTAAIKTEGRFFRAHSAGAGAADIFALPVIHTTYWQGSPCGHELTIGQPQP